MTHTKEQLQEMKVAELRKLCQENDLETKGLKSLLVKRLTEKYEQEMAQEEGLMDTNAEYHNGVVTTWKRGYGFIQIGDSLEAGEDKPEWVYVNRRNIVMMEGQEAELRRGMSVMFKKGKSKDGLKIRAEDVKNTDGKPIDWFSQNGEHDREIYHEDTYSGVIGNFNWSDFYGFVLPDEEITSADGETIDLCYRLILKGRDFVGEKPAIRPGRAVRFKLFRIGEKYGATSITDPEGNPLEKADEKEKGSEEIDEAKRYTGRVLQFGTNSYGFILCHEDLAAYGANSKIWFKSEDVNTDDQPAFVAPGMEVSFTIYKNKKGFGAKDVSMPKGGKIVLPEGTAPKDYVEVMPRESFEDLEFEGKVAAYFWDKGFGIVKIDFTSSDVKVPEDVKDKIKDEKVYFRWSDINSSDKTVGINRNTNVKFNLYKDAKGIGAENICTPDGDAISGADRSKGSWRRKRQGGWKQGGKKKQRARA